MVSSQDCDSRVTLVASRCRSLCMPIGSVIAVRRLLPRRSSHQVLVALLLCLLAALALLLCCTFGRGDQAGASAEPVDDAAAYQRITTAAAVFDAGVDAIVVPGGGSQRGASPRTLPAPVRRRLDLAMLRWYELRDRFPASPPPYIIVLSAGTVHKPNYIDQNGWPVLEATSEAQYIVEVSRDDERRPIPARLILRESVSLDTIGNAYFARVIHTEPLGLRRLHVITSGFHLERTRAIFEFVFSIPNRNPFDDGDKYVMTYEASSDKDVQSGDLAARVARERDSLASFGKLLMDKFGLQLQTAPRGSLHSSLDTDGDDGKISGGGSASQSNQPPPVASLPLSTLDDVRRWNIAEATRSAKISLRMLNQWMYSAHSAYATGSRAAVSADVSLLSTY